GDLRERAPPFEPVERLAAEDRRERTAGRRDLLRTADEDVRPARNERAHLRVRLDGRHRLEALEEQARELARARTQVENARFRAERELALGQVERGSRPRGPAQLVRIGDAAEQL